jgi:hypothetical protein
MMNMKVIGYWTSTAAVAFVLVVDGVVGLLHGRVMLVGKPLDEVMERLGYPAYFLKILGVWKPLGAIALLAPGFPRRKRMGVCRHLHQYDRRGCIECGARR